MTNPNVGGIPNIMRFLKDHAGPNEAACQAQLQVAIAALHDAAIQMVRATCFRALTEALEPSKPTTASMVYPLGVDDPSEGGWQP